MVLLVGNKKCRFFAEIQMGIRESYYNILVFCCDISTQVFIISNMHVTVVSLSVSVDDDPRGATVWPSAA